MSNRTQREAFVMSAIYKQFELANVDQSVLETDKDAWFSNNTMTPQQHEEWKIWFIAESRKVFKINKKVAEREFQFFDLSYGLKIKE